MIPRAGCQLILGLEPIEAMRRAIDYLAPHGIVLLNSRINEPLETKMGKQPNLELDAICQQLEKLGAGRVLEINAMKLATDAGGSATVNVVMLGALLSVAGFPLSYESIAKGIETSGKLAYLEPNLRSLNAGYEYAMARQSQGATI
jgi:indolepyruvate ferredoxin oxidoreductase beta subunit